MTRRRSTSRGAGLLPASGLRFTGATNRNRRGDSCPLLDRMELLRTCCATKIFGQFPTAAEPTGHTPVARCKSGLVIEIVTRTDSNLQQLPQLRGKCMKSIPSSQGIALLVNRRVATELGLATPAKSIFEARSRQKSRVPARSRPAPGVPWVVTRARPRHWANRYATIPCNARISSPSVGTTMTFSARP